jgi:hypothetical protein
MVDINYILTATDPTIDIYFSGGNGTETLGLADTALYGGNVTGTISGAGWVVSRVSTGSAGNFVHISGKMHFSKNTGLTSWNGQWNKNGTHQYGMSSWKQTANPYTYIDELRISNNTGGTTIGAGTTVKVIKL